MEMVATEGMASLATADEAELKVEVVEWEAAQVDLEAKVAKVGLEAGFQRNT